MIDRCSIECDSTHGARQHVHSSNNLKHTAYGRPCSQVLPLVTFVVLRTYASLTDWSDSLPQNRQQIQRKESDADD